MIPAAQIEAARAVFMPALVAQDRKVQRHGSVYFALCPSHPDKRPSLAVYGDHAFCFACRFRADPIEWLRVVRGMDFASAINELASGYTEGARRRPTTAGSIGPEVTQPHTPSIEPPAAIFSLWDDATDPSIARVYLRSRGLPYEPLSQALRGHPAVYCSETRQHRPCVLATVRDSAGTLVAVQRIWTRTTYLADEQDARPTDLKIRKKTLGHLGDGAVRLAPAGERLGLAEGVETALAASQLYRLPVWAVLGVARYGHAAGWRERQDGSRYRVEAVPPHIWIPPSVAELVVFGDRGEVGEEAALWASAWWRRQGLTARALFPSEGKDFAEMVAC